jgi:hypothetical protein
MRVGRHRAAGQRDAAAKESGRHLMQRSTFEALEKQFWEGDAAFYEDNLSLDALMVFPQPVGVLTRSRIIESVRAAPRWSAVSFERMHFLQLNEDAVMLAYTARARRTGEHRDYVAIASSAYVRRSGRFWLAFHQQTPALD